MANQETKRQHYVPKTYLNKFGFERKAGEFSIYGMNKSDLSKSIPLSTSNICVKKNYYTLSGETEQERQIIENFYGSQFEADYDKMYNLITDDAITEIDNAMRGLIIGTITTLLFRTTKWTNTHNNTIDRAVKYIFELAHQNGSEHINIEGTRINIKDKNVNQVIKEISEQGKEAITITQLEMALKLAKLRENDGISIVKIDSQDCFLTSDHPVVIHDPESKKIVPPFDPSNTLMLPVNGRYRIDLYPPEVLTDKNKIVRISHTDILATAEISVNNREQFLNAETFILGDKNTLDSLNSNMSDTVLAKKIKDALDVKLEESLAILNKLNRN